MMTLYFLFFCLFSSLALLSSVLVILSKSPVFSVLFLILTFCNVSGLLFLLNLEFLPITFLVVYVGAIAVLFLFVIMMLNIKLSELKSDSAHFYPIALLLSFVFFLDIFLLTQLDFVPLFFSFAHESFAIDSVSHYLNFMGGSLNCFHENNLQSIGRVLFVEHAFQFVLVGFVLLLAMVGAIVLTLQKTFLSKTQNVYLQVLQNFDKCVVFYS